MLRIHSATSEAIIVNFEKYKCKDLVLYEIISGFFCPPMLVMQATSLSQIDIPMPIAHARTSIQGQGTIRILWSFD